MWEFNEIEFCSGTDLILRAIHMSRASPADLSHENLYFSTT